MISSELKHLIHGEGVEPDGKGLNISSIYGSLCMYIYIYNVFLFICVYVCVLNQTGISNGFRLRLAPKLV